MLGNESGDMMLEQGLTRAQMAALLTRIVTDPEQFETDSAFYRSLCSFTDVPEWAKSYVGYCVANNLVAGYGNGRYGSNDPVTSAAACTVMLRCLNDVDAVWDYQSACRTAVQLGLAAEKTVADAEIKYLRVRQLHALVQAHYRTQGIKIDERRMEIMLRQMRTGTNYVWLRGDVVSYGDRRIDPRLLEALDVMLELTRVQPGFYSKDGLHEPFLLRFTGNGKGAGYLFSVAWLDAATHIATVPRMKGERIIWISESGSFGEIDLPRHHFFAARQKDGTHRFFGSNEPEKI